MDAPFPDKMMPCIEKFFREVHPTLEPGQDVYPEVFYTDLFFPLQRMRETAKMMRVARRYEPGCVVEIGADKGGGFYHWLMCLPSVKYAMAVEIRGTPYARLFDVAFPVSMLSWYGGSSRDSLCLEYAEKFLPKINVLFIDGEKPSMFDDFMAYRPMMADRSVVFLHDINDSYGRPALDRIRKLGYRCHEIIDTSEVATAVAREVNDVPPANPYEGWLRHWRGESAGVGVIYIGEPRT